MHANATRHFLRTDDAVPSNNGRPMKVSISSTGRQSFDVDGITSPSNLELALIVRGVPLLIRRQIYTIVSERGYAPKFVFASQRDFVVTVSFADNDPRLCASHPAEEASSEKPSFSGFGMQ